MEEVVFEKKYPGLLDKVEDEIASAVSAVLQKYPQLRELKQWGVDSYVNYNDPTKENVISCIYVCK